MERFLSSLLLCLDTIQCKNKEKQFIMELEELEMISNKVKFGIVIIGLLGGLF